MRQLPIGTLTLLFTAIEGSTGFLQHLGHRYAGVLRVCRRLLRSAFQQRDGQEVDTQGDASFVVFEHEKIVRKPSPFFALAVTFFFV